MFRKSFLGLALVLVALLAVAGSVQAIPTTSPRDLTRTVSYGEPLTVHTAVLRTSAIVLGPDEQLRSIAQADGERWRVEWSEYGPDGRTVPVVTVTPTDCGLTTSLLILTTRRIYSVMVDSPPCTLAQGEFNPSFPFDPVVRFRYPDDQVVQSVPRGPREPESLDAAQPKSGVIFSTSLEDLLHRAGTYSVKAQHRYRGPWPMIVTDDGQTTFLIFRKGAFKGRDLPLLFLVDERGERQLANYDVEGAIFRIHTTFTEAVLVEGDPKRRRTPHLRIRKQ